MKKKFKIVAIVACLSLIVSSMTVAAQSQDETQVDYEVSPGGEDGIVPESEESAEMTEATEAPDDTATTEEDTEQETTPQDDEQDDEATQEAPDQDESDQEESDQEGSDEGEIIDDPEYSPGYGHLPGCGHGCVAVPTLTVDFEIIDEPFPIDPPSDSVSNEAEEYQDDTNCLSVIDITTGRYYTDDIELQPHKIYAIHASLEGSHPWETTANFAHPVEFIGESDVQFVLATDGGIPIETEVFKISAAEKLQLQLIGTQPTADPIQIDGMSYFSMDVPAYETEVIFFFQTVAEGEDPIIILDEPLDPDKIAGVPYLYPVGFDTGLNYEIGDSIIDLPKIASRSSWVSEHP